MGDDVHAAIGRSLAAKHQTRRVITKPEGVAAIRQVVARLGHSELNRNRYDEVRETRSTPRPCAVPPAWTAHRSLAGSQQITATFGSFADAAKAAGATIAEVERRQRITRAQAVAVFVEHFGFRPSQRDLQWFGRHHRVQMTFLHSEPHSQAVAAARAQFEEMGRWFPALASAKDRPADWEQLGDDSEVLADLASRFPRRRTRQEGFSPEEIREAIAKAYDALAPGQRLTAAVYRQLTDELGLPSVKTIYQAAADDSQTFRSLVKAEEQRRAKAARKR